MLYASQDRLDADIRKLPIRPVIMAPISSLVPSTMSEITETPRSLWNNYAADQQAPRELVENIIELIPPCRGF